MKNRMAQLMAGMMTGGLMVATAAADQVRYITPFAFTTIPGSSSAFTSPQGIALGTNGDLYVTDLNAETVSQMALVGTNWVVTTIAGTSGNYGSDDGTNGGIQFGSPVGVAADSANNLYIVDMGYNTVRKLTQVGTNWISSTIAGTPDPIGGTADGTNGDAQFSFPNGIATDTTGDLYVADSYNNAIRKITHVGTNWVVTTIAGVADPNTHGSADGTNEDAQFYLPYCLTVDHSGNIFVADDGNNTIRKITPMGTNWVVTTIAGTTGVLTNYFNDGTNETALFDEPFGITVDANDNLYLADTYNNAIRRLAPKGTNWVATTLGGRGIQSPGNTDGIGGVAQFDYPFGIALDNSGTVYISEADSSLDIHDIRIGSLAPNVKPFLAINMNGYGGYLITWAQSTSFALQTNTDLSTDNWGDYTGPIITSNGTNTATVVSPTGNVFFRLGL